MSVIDILFIVFCIVLVLQLFYYTYIFNFFPKVLTAPKNKNKDGVSVLIHIKNNAQEFKANSSHFFNQSYPNYEIVLINDGSTDNSLEILEDLSKQNPKLRIVNVKPVEAFWGNKKYALTLGIKSSKFEQLLFTHASCKPSSKHWISQMAGQFTPTKHIVLGYSTYQKKAKSFFNKFLRFEALYTALQYISYANYGLPFMGDGCNLAYKKSVFFDVNGFISHIDLKQGEDDLLINQSATKHNIAASISGKSIISLPPDTTFKKWFLRKRTQLSTFKRYKLNHKISLGLFYYSQLIFWLVALILAFSNYAFPWLLGLLVFRFIVLYITIGKVMKRVKETDLILWIPFLEIALVSLQLTIFIKNWISKQEPWK